MSYRVLALKWRPQNFDDVIGQEHIISTLKSALEKNRLAHAYLFSGPRGVGKTSTARILAKALNCKEGPTVNPCQKCSCCLEINQGRSFDVIEIDGASNRGIDEIRVLRENVKFSPAGGKYKIYIIDEVHMLTQEAFNALLKTLEEPPEFVKFIFATTQPQKVIATIISRCQRFDFRRIPLIEIIAQLKKITASEKVNVDKEVLLTIAKSSDGSLRDAESILDQIVSFSKDSVSLKDVVSVLGLIENEVLFNITDKIIQKDAKALLQLLNNIIDEGKDAGILLSSLMEHFRNLMIAKIVKADAKLIDLPQEICERLTEQAEAISLEEIFNAFNVLANAQEMSKRLESIRIPLEISLVKLAYDKKTPSSALPQSKPVYEIKKSFVKEERPSLDRGKKDIVETDKPKPPAEAPNKETHAIEPPVQSITLDKVTGIWQNIITGLGVIKMSVATYLNEGIPVKLENNILTVSFSKNHSLHKESLEQQNNKLIIEKIISGLLNTKLKVDFILSKEASQKIEHEDSFVKSALDAFKGRVIKKD